MPILDQFGRPFKATAKPERREIAVTSIRDRWSGYPSENITPVRLAHIFKEADSGDVYRQMELFEEMEEKDTHLSAELLKRKNAVNALDFDIVPYEEGLKGAGRKRAKAKPDKVCDFCRDVIYSMPNFEDALFDLLDAIGKGFAVSEIVWDTDSGRAVVTDLKWIHQKKLIFTETMHPRLMTDDHPTGEEIPAFKVIYHRHKARSGYDTRAGMLRVCAWMYLFKNYSIKDWVAFSEVFGMPLRLGKYDPGATKEDKEALVQAIRSLGSDAAGIISKSTEIEFVEAIRGRTEGNLYRTLTDFCNREMSKAIVGATLTTDVGERGSYAASKTHNEVRLDLVKSDAWSLANTLRMQLLRPLVGFNFGWDVPVPWFQFQLQEPEDLEKLSKVYKNLVEMGQPISAEHVSERFGVPLPEEGEIIITPPGRGPSAMKQIAAKSGRESTISGQAIPNNYRVAGKGASEAKYGPGQGAIEELIASVEAKDALAGMLSPVIRLIEESRSFEEILERLHEAYPDMDPASFEQLLSKAMFAADLWGYLRAKEETGGSS